jgi:uncharacterized protein (DUF4415 family)
MRLSEGLAEDRTDWARVDAMTDEEIERNAREDPDSVLVGSVDWSQANLVIPPNKESIHLRLDPDILAWFKSSGPGYHTRINAVLRHYVEAQEQQPKAMVVR